MTATDAMAIQRWPRGLSEREAAAYVGVGVDKFRREVREGIWPPGDRRGGRVVWDRALLDLAYDRRSGIVPGTDIDLDDEFEPRHARL